MPEQTYLTRAGLAKLQQEAETLQREKRRLSEEVGRAAQLGDLRENAEYAAAKEKLQQVLDRLNDLSWKLAHVSIVDDLPVRDGTAALGCRVTVKDPSGREQIFTLVGPDEADPATGHLSIASPIGKALLGQKAQAAVKVQLPAGPKTFQILSIRR
ncbi:MAG: transcription elongation factor GreA [Candidatus Omnitrophica bacterium]|nr:transcription elongation factor GreA [Candidatus Omnitrophota bacterium]